MDRWMDRSVDRWTDRWTDVRKQRALGRADLGLDEGAGVGAGVDGGGVLAHQLAVRVAADETVCGQYLRNSRINVCVRTLAETAAA